MTNIHIACNNLINKIFSNNRFHVNNNSSYWNIPEPTLQRFKLYRFYQSYINKIKIIIFWVQTCCHLLAFELQILKYHNHRWCHHLRLAQLLPLLIHRVVSTHTHHCLPSYFCGESITLVHKFKNCNRTFICRDLVEIKETKFWQLD